MWAIDSFVCDRLVNWQILSAWARLRVWARTDCVGHNWMCMRKCIMFGDLLIVVWCWLQSCVALVAILFACRPNGWFHVGLCARAVVGFMSVCVFNIPGLGNIWRRWGAWEGWLPAGHKCGVSTSVCGEGVASRRRCIVDDLGLRHFGVVLAGLLVVV